MVETEIQVGERLVDRGLSGKERPWVIHKVNNERLSFTYDEVDPQKAERLRGCASFLVFRWDEGRARLKKADFCRVRLCPICTWRRSLKLQSQMHTVLRAMEAAKMPYAFVYLTLTVKNMTGDKLSALMDEMNGGFKRLVETKEVKNAIHGFFKSTEVTHNVDHASKDFDTYHPHMHVLLAVRPSYFTNRSYIRQERWTELWQKAMRLDYVPNVNIKRVKGNTAKAVAEAAGYSAKSESFIIPDDWDLTVETVRLLDGVLANRRLVGFGGIIREYHRKLNLEHPEDGDLIHVDKDELAADGRSREVCYAWFSGYRQYCRVEE